MELSQFFSDFEDLNRKLSGWSNDDHSRSILLLELESIEELEAGNDICKCFPWACFGCAEDVSSFEEVGQRSGLNMGRLSIVMKG